MLVFMLWHVLRIALFLAHSLVDISQPIIVDTSAKVYSYSDVIPKPPTGSGLGNWWRLTFTDSVTS